MARKWTLSEQVEFMRADARRAQRREEAARVAQESAWERRHAELMVEQQAAGLAAAEAARAEARAQGERTRLHAWMMASPVGRAWAQVTAPGGADSVLAQRVEARCVAWRRAWAEQCQGDGLAPVTARAAHGEAVADLLRFLAWMLAFVAVVLFALNTVGWLWNHSWFTPEMSGGIATQGGLQPRHGTREFFTPGLAVASYVAAGAAAAGWVGALILDRRQRAKRGRLARQATERNAALVAERTQRYGFDPLGERLPDRAQWVVLPDTTDPEDARQRRQHEYMNMEHVEQLRSIALWGGAARQDTPAGLPARMVAELQRLRG